MAREQRITSPVRVFASTALTDGTSNWSLSLNQSGFFVPTRLVTTAIIASDATKALVSEDDRVVLAGGLADNMSLEVYNTASNDGAMVTIKRTDTTNYIVTITTEDADNIDGQAEIYLQAQYDSVTLVANGGNWHII